MNADMKNDFLSNVQRQVNDAFEGAKAEPRISQMEAEQIKQALRAAVSAASPFASPCELQALTEALIASFVKVNEASSRTYSPSRPGAPE